MLSTRDKDAKIRLIAVGMTSLMSNDLHNSESRYSSCYVSQTIHKFGRVAKQIDVVLLSHSDLAHLGCHSIRVQSTWPNMPHLCHATRHPNGHICMYNLYLSKSNELDFTTFSLDDIE